MSRVKKSSKLKHKKILKLSKGYTARRKNVYRISKQAVIKSLVYAYRDRKVKKRNFRSNWIVCINFFLRIYGFKYNLLIYYLKKYFLFYNKKIFFQIITKHYDFIKCINIIFFYYFNCFNL